MPAHSRRSDAAAPENPVRASARFTAILVVLLVVAMGSAELRRAAGQHSAVAGVPEAIHRDNLVLL